MGVRERIERRLPLLHRVLVDPPHRIARRFVTTGIRSGLLGAGGDHPLDVLRCALSRGVGVRSMHAIHAAADPERIAMVDERRAIAYRDIDREIDAVAAVLRDHLGASRNVPVAVMMAGGYGRRIDDTVAIHRRTLHEAWGSWRQWSSSPPPCAAG